MQAHKPWKHQSNDFHKNWNSDDIIMASLILNGRDIKNKKQSSLLLTFLKQIFQNAFNFRSIYCFVHAETKRT
jgi:hypothetical protein